MLLSNTTNHLYDYGIQVWHVGRDDIVHECMSMFNVLRPESAIAKRKCKFLSNVVASDNLLCTLCCDQAYAATDLQTYSVICNDNQLNFYFIFLLIVSTISLVNKSCQIVGAVGLQRCTRTTDTT